MSRSNFYRYYLNLWADLIFASSFSPPLLYSPRLFSPCDGYIVDLFFCFYVYETEDRSPIVFIASLRMKWKKNWRNYCRSFSSPTDYECLMCMCARVNKEELDPKRWAIISLRPRCNRKRRRKKFWILPLADDYPPSIFTKRTIIRHSSPRDQRRSSRTVGLRKIRPFRLRGPGARTFFLRIRCSDFRGHAEIRF